MRKTVLRLLSVLTIAMSASRVDAASLAEIQHRNYMVVAVANDASPFAVVAHDKRVGFDADLLVRLRKSVHFAIREKFVPRASLVASVTSGEADAIASSIEITPERQASLDFAPPVAESTLYYLKRRSDASIRSLADLGGLRLGLPAGSEGFLSLTELEHHLAKDGKPLGEIVEYPKGSGAFAALTAKRVDYVVGDIVDLAVVARSKPALYAVGEPVARPSFVGWAVAKGNADLAAFLKAFMLKERASGDLAALQQKWLARSFTDLPESVTAQDWWATRSDRPAEFPIPTLRDPD